MEVLRVKNISKSIKNKQIINEISFDISEGQIVGLLGPNGAGKTTTFYSILGLIKIDSGEVFLDNKDITMIPPHKRAEVLKKEDLINFYQNTIKEFGLESIEDSMGYVLSGGQRRKVEIARCLASKPKIILLDEPFAGIDPLAIQDIKNVLKSLSDKGICILITDHNLRETIDICNYSIVIKDGSILDKGEKDYLINSSLIKEEYFGTVFD